MKLKEPLQSLRDAKNEHLLDNVPTQPQSSNNFIIYCPFLGPFKKILSYGP